MPYGNSTLRPADLVSTHVRGPGDADFRNVSWHWLSPTTESRGGSNHAPLVPGTRIPRYRFSKDGKSVRVYAGYQEVPVRRYRWVGKHPNARKQYYIVYVKRHEYVTIPTGNYTLRQSSGRPDQTLNLLRPNPLTYSKSETVVNGSVGNSHAYYQAPGQPPESFQVVYTGHASGLLKPGVSQSNLSSRHIAFENVSHATFTSQMRSQLKSRTLSALYEKVASRFPDVGTMLAESRESVSTLQKVLNEGIDLVRDLVKKDKRRLLGRLKMPADFASRTWLTYIYGIKPLVNDVLDLPNLGDTGIRTYKTKRSYNDNATVIVDDGAVRWIVNRYFDVDYTFGVVMSSDLSTRDKLGAANLNNPIGVGYNMIPFSFMLDWFIDIGSYLNSQSALQYGFIYGWETVAIKQRWITFQQRRENVGSGRVRFYAPSTAGKRETVSVIRTPLSKTSFPSMPTPKIESSPISELRGLNALAIAIANYRKL